MASTSGLGAPAIVRYMSGPRFTLGAGARFALSGAAPIVGGISVLGARSVRGKMLRPVTSGDGVMAEPELLPARRAPRTPAVPAGGRVGEPWCIIALPSGVSSFLPDPRVAALSASSRLFWTPEARARLLLSHTLPAAPPRVPMAAPPRAPFSAPPIVLSPLEPSAFTAPVMPPVIAPVAMCGAIDARPALSLFVSIPCSRAARPKSPKRDRTPAPGTASLTKG